MLFKLISKYHLSMMKMYHYLSLFVEKIDDKSKLKDILIDQFRRHGLKELELLSRHCMAPLQEDE